jgi:hypothetical protein
MRQPVSELGKNSAYIVVTLWNAFQLRDVRGKRGVFLIFAGVKIVHLPLSGLPEGLEATKFAETYSMFWSMPSKTSHRSAFHF